jgi:hypothetical protein
LADGEQYWTLELRRDELLDVLQRRGIQHLIPVWDPAEIEPPPGKITAIWRNGSVSDRTLLPQVMIGRPHDLDDLWAWAFSYLRGLGPLTAQTRVLTLEEYRSALLRRHIYKWW